MEDNKQKDFFISDSGMIVSNKKLHSKIFVTLCRIISVVLVVLGVLAFVEGNF